MRGTPYSSPTPATPDSSVSSAPDVAIARPPTEIHAQTGPEYRADQLAMASAGEDAETHGQFLHEVKDRYQHELQTQQSIAPLRAGLCRR